MAVGHLFQTYLPDNKSLTQFWGHKVQAGRDTDWWNGAIWAASSTLLCWILLCPHLQVPPLLQLYSAIALLHAKEERRHTAVLSGTCGVQNAVITNSGRPIYVTRQRPGGHLHIAEPTFVLLLLSYIWTSRTQHLLSNASVPKFSFLVCHWCSQQKAKQDHTALTRLTKPSLWIVMWKWQTALRSSVEATPGLESKQAAAGCCGRLWDWRFRWVRWVCQAHTPEMTHGTISACRGH